MFSRQQDKYVGDESSDAEEIFEEADGYLGRNGNGIIDWTTHLLVIPILKILWKILKRFAHTMSL